MSHKTELEKERMSVFIDDEYIESGAAQIENPLNVGDELPFGYMNPETEGKLTWICNKDAQGTVTSVFAFDTGSGVEKKVSYLKDIDEAIQFRDELIRNGWTKIKPPKIEITYPGADGKERPLNRKQRRALQRKLKSAARRTMVNENI